MKQIKYRAWHKLRKFMSEVLAIHWDTKQVSLATSKNGATQYLWDIDDVVLMQFTGLLDKNDKEIYEKDILQHQNEEADTTPYVVPNITQENWGQLAGIGDSEWEEGENQYSNIEVLGNLYEDTHFLK